MTKKKAIVVGATGLVGHELVNQLLSDPDYYEIRTLSRRPLAINSSSKLKQTIIDFDDLAEHKAQVTGDVLFCCLGTTIKQAGSKQAQELVDLTYPSQIAQYAKENGIQNVVLISSASASIKSKQFYFNLKGRLEQNFINQKFESLIIVRPSVLLGKRESYRFGEWLAACLLRLFQFVPAIKKYRPITGQQVASKMRQLVAVHARGLVYCSLDELFE